MLSNTYIRIVCANENNRIRNLLDRLRREAEKTSAVDGIAVYMCALVEKIELERRTRRFDKFILPFIKADDSRTGVVEKMDEIRKDISVCVDLLLSVIKESNHNGTIDRQLVAPEINRYCDLNSKLLDYEESRLGISGREGVAEEGWFALAESFIKEDKELFDGKYLNEKEVLNTVPESSVWWVADAKTEYRV